MTSPLIIVTDMDGTLLDHHTYSAAPALPLVRRLLKANIPVIPCTSKTRAEMSVLTQSLGLPPTCIVENGAGIVLQNPHKDHIPAGATWLGEPSPLGDATASCAMIGFVRPRAHWQGIIEQVRPQFLGDFITFEEAGISGIKEMTGLDDASAALAAQREFGEPIYWQGSEDARQQFITALFSIGANVLQGGRFMHVSGGCNKGRALRWLKEYWFKTQGSEVKTIALGDSHNDAAMLEAADFPCLIRSPVKAPPTLSCDAPLSPSCGPEGWVESVERILKQEGLDV